jgi:hypothetical protein
VDSLRPGRPDGVDCGARLQRAGRNSVPALLANKSGNGCDSVKTFRRGVVNHQRRDGWLRLHSFAVAACNDPAERRGFARFAARTQSGQSAGYRFLRFLAHHVEEDYVPAGYLLGVGLRWPASTWPTRSVCGPARKPGNAGSSHHPRQLPEVPSDRRLLRSVLRLRCSPAWWRGNHADQGDWYLRHSDAVPQGRRLPRLVDFGWAVLCLITQNRPTGSRKAHHGKADRPQSPVHRRGT